MKREHQDSRNEKTYLRMETGYGSIFVLIQESERAFVESADRITKYDPASYNPVAVGSPLQIKDIDYSFTGHLTRANEQWKFCPESWAFSAQTSGGGLTARREQLVKSIIEQTLNDWERVNPDEAARTHYEAELIAINNSIYYAAEELEKAEKEYKKATDKFDLLSYKEVELKRHTPVASLT